MTIPVSPSAGGPAPDSGQPQAGTPAPAAIPAPGALPQTPQAGIGQTTQPRFVFNSQEELDAFADRLLDQRRRANREAQTASSEVGALRQEVQQLLVQQRLAAQRAIAADVQLLAKTAGFRNPGFIYGAISSQLQYDPTGQPTNVQAILDALKASDPYLLEAPPTAGQPPAPAQPGLPQIPPGQPALAAPGVLPQPQPRAGLMNAPQSAVGVPGGGLTWETINANIKNQAWVAANTAQLETFMADPLNHQQRPR